MKRIMGRAGQRFGRLTAIREVDPIVSTAGRVESMWLCRCDCGVEKVIRERTLTPSGMRTTQSCGCLNRELSGNRAKVNNATHGESRVGKATPEYRSWASALTRCRNVNNRSFPRYGGRGIKVCPQWNPQQGGSYEQFLADMGRRPTPRHTLERKDNNGPYAPWNCVWATKKEQASNRRSGVMVELDGETITLTEAARRRGVKMQTAHKRLRDGRSLEEALSHGRLPKRRRSLDALVREIRG
jgi:hypothetical protein